MNDLKDQSVCQEVIDEIQKTVEFRYNKHADFFMLAVRFRLFSIYF